MTYQSFLNEIIRLGIEGAHKSYSKPEDAQRLAGSIEGYDACRNKQPGEILNLLVEARRENQVRYFESTENDTPAHLDIYWKSVCKMMEIEWVANVLSAGVPDMEPIVPVTARGYMMASRILGVMPESGPVTSPVIMTSVTTTV